MEIRIAVLPGDGIGPEVIAEAEKVIGAVQKRISDVHLNLERFDAGAMCYLETGKALPEKTLEGCTEAHAILLGAAGLPNVVHPDGREVGPDAGLGLRFHFDLYANVRPIILLPGIRSPLAEDKHIDYVIIRENTEGLYASRNGGNILRDEIATDTIVVTRHGTERVCDFAFSLAQKRSASSGRMAKVTCVDKANILRTYSFFRKVFNEVAEDYPDVEKDYAYVDAMTLWQVLRPETYDVVVTENMFGDIISDLGAATVGGMGMAPSAEIGVNKALFQGAHGSAPDIAGKGQANPIATILSAGMMMGWLGEQFDHSGLRDMEEEIKRAVIKTIEQGVMTGDVGGRHSTQEVGDEIVRNLLA
ncbi:MAG: isocitrate/isopropylmalate dehydrogenase family protein [Limnochordia bacterium]|jgi:3-isopropylmalate dehydrogenase